MLVHGAEESKGAGEIRTLRIDLSDTFRSADQHVKLSCVGTRAWMWHGDLSHQRCRRSSEMFLHCVRRNRRRRGITFHFSPYLHSCALRMRLDGFQKILRKTRLVFVIEPLHAEVLTRLTRGNELALAVDIKHE